MKDQDWFTRVWYKSNFLKFLFLEDILHVDIYYMSPKKARAPTFWGVGRFAAFYKNYELVAVFDYDNWHYAIDEYCNFVIVVKNGFFSEKNIHDVIGFSWKRLKNCPRHVKTALGISGVGEG